MLFNGNFIDSNFLPYSYIFKWIYISTQFFIQFFCSRFLISKRFSLRFINIKNNCPIMIYGENNEKKDLFIFFCLISIVSYLVFLILLFILDGGKYILNIFIIYISTLHFIKIEIYLKTQNRKKIYYFLTILFLIFITFKMFIYHPYQNIYFNFLLIKKLIKNLKLTIGVCQVKNF